MRHYNTYKRQQIARAIYYSSKQREYAEHEARIDALGLRDEFNQFLKTFKCQYQNKKYYYFFKTIEKQRGHKLISAWQVRRMLDRAFYQGYSRKKFDSRCKGVNQSDRNVWLWLADNKEDFTINEVDEMIVGWYEDFVDDIPAFDGVMYDIDADKFVDYKFYDDGTVETFGYIK